MLGPSFPSSSAPGTPFMKIGLLCGIFVLICPALSAQSLFGFEECIELPNLSLDSADHAVLAINDNGDIFVAWHSFRSDLFGTPRQVEGAFLKRTGPGTWKSPDPATDVFLLGDPVMGIYGSIDNCRKPDVVAIGNDFVVTWPRGYVFTDPVNRLEAAHIQVDGSGYAAVRSPGPGVGYLLDANINKGGAGVMPDLIHDPAIPGTASVIYAHEITEQSGRRDYELRIVSMDFRNGANIFPKKTLVPSFPLDNSKNLGAPPGGMVLPDAVVDDFGNIVVAYGEYVREGHNGATEDEGTLVVKRFGVNGLDFIEYETIRLHGRAFNHRQRRPNVATSRNDVNNSVMLSWMDNPDQEGADVDVATVEMLFSDNHLGQVIVNDQSFPNIADRSDYYPIPVQAKAMRLTFNIRVEPTSGRKLTAYVRNQGPNLLDVNISATQPWRPHADMLEVPPYGAKDSRIIPMCFEAESTGGTTRIFVIVYKI